MRESEENFKKMQLEFNQAVAEDLQDINRRGHHTRVAAIFTLVWVVALSIAVMVNS